MASYPRANGGSAILEFAFIAPVFFLLLFAIIEIGVIFFAQSTLQHATNNLGRMIRTGQVQGQNLTQDAVRQLVCNDISALIPCDNNLYIDIEAFSGFGSITFTPPVDQNGNMIPQNNFKVGNACDVVLVRIFDCLVGGHAIVDAVPGERFRQQSSAVRLVGIPQRTIHHGNQRMLKLLRKFRKAKSGIVAVEFAFVLPVMMVLVFGAIEVTSALVCKADVSNMASTAADLIAQESSVGTSDMNNVFASMTSIIYPYTTNGMQIVITSVVDDGKGGGMVDWSKTNTGTARTKGASVPVPTGLISTGGSVILTEVTYAYTTPSNYLIQLPIQMANTFYTRPRRVPQVKWTS